MVGYLADNPAVYLESYLVSGVTRWVTRCAMAAYLVGYLAGYLMSYLVCCLVENLANCKLKWRVTWCATGRVSCVLTGLVLVICRGVGRAASVSDDDYIEHKNSWCNHDSERDPHRRVQSVTLVTL